MRTHKADGVRISIDIGGTFTDLVLSRGDQTLFVNKTSSTPADPGEAVLTGLREILDRLNIGPDEVTEIVHGTTVGSNTILQRKGALTGLITTRGCRDVLEIGRIRTPEMFNLAWEKPEPLSHRRYRREVSERVAADGAIVAALNPDEVVAVCDEMIAEGVNSVAVCFLNSYVNPLHEKMAVEAIRAKYPDLHVTASHEVLPEIKEYERTSTTVVNAYLLPEMQSYIDRLGKKIAELGINAPLQVVTSNGGMMAASKAAQLPVFAVASGPAGGVTGAASIEQTFGYGDLIVFDMGGTTAKASIVENGQPSLVMEYEFRDGISSPSRFIKGGGYMLKVPAVDIAEVGAGGGSIAAIDAGGLLTVGPASAGSNPGPACYGIGNGLPTVTDANMCLGYLNPESLAGGSLKVHRDKAVEAIKTHIADPLGLSVNDAAHGVRQLANVSMARAIRSVTVERGRDPRDMSVIAFGGGGPLHAVDVAKMLDVRRVIIPVMSGVFSAAGMLTADVTHNFVKSFSKRLAAVESEWLDGILSELALEGRQALAAEGYEEAAMDMRFSLDLRYVGQSSELNVALTAADSQTWDGDAVTARFYDEYRTVYGYATEEGVEISAIRLTAVGRAERLSFGTAMVDPEATRGMSGTRMVCFERGKAAVETRLVPRSDVGGDPQAGPAIIESYDTTIVVPSGATFRSDAIGNVIVEIEAREDR